MKMSKRILLICPSFFNYDNIIKSELEIQGNEVFLVSDRPYVSALYKAGLRAFPRIFGFFGNQRFKAILKNLYLLDEIIVIQGEGLSSSLLKWLFTRHPSSLKIFYSWDSVKNKKGFISNKEMYDKVVTFDRKDALRYNLQFLPLFYHERSKPYNSLRRYNLCFIGTAHSDRLAILEPLITQVTGDNYIFLYVQHKVIFYFKWLTSRDYRRQIKSSFNFSPLSYNQVLGKMEDSVVVVDVHHPLQSGLTMRTFEALALGCKLITTNEDIVNYDFYDERFIQVIKREGEIRIRENFFSPLDLNPSQLLSEKYHIRCWLKSLREN
jgi:hypothetical protein